jgi:hypothetical protein
MAAVFLLSVLLLSWLYRRALGGRRHRCDATATCTNPAFWDEVPDGLTGTVLVLVIRPASRFPRHSPTWHSTVWM